MFLIVFIFLSFAYYSDSFESFVTMLLGIVLSLISVWSVWSLKSFLVPFYIYSFGGVFVTSFALLTFHNTIHFVDILWIIAAVQLGFFGIGKRIGMMLLSCAIIVIAIFIFFIINIHIEQVTIRSDYQNFTLIIELASAFLLNLYFVFMLLGEYEVSIERFKETVFEKMKQNKLIESQNQEKSILIREVHYRVKENLQIISTFLRMQQHEINSEEVKTVFVEAINRVDSMLLVHNKLYKGNKLTNASVYDYVKGLIKDSVGLSLLRNEVEINVRTNVSTFDMKTLLPIGLILNELTSNAIKHAFPNKSNPCITIEIMLIDNVVKLIFIDNGTWKQNTNSKSSFGLALIEMLTEQLEGKIKVEKNQDSTMYLLLFPYYQQNEKEKFINSK
jgi:two-component sensor histidine kinase